MKNKNFLSLSFAVAIMYFSFGFSNANAATYVSCSSDGSASGQACSINGNHGICNGAGVCVDAKSGPICTGNGKTSGQACVINGNYGICNGADVCVDAKSGPIPASNTGNSSTKNSGAANTANGTSFTNPLEFKTVEDFLGGIMSAVQKIIVVLALVFIVLGAVLYITAGANPENAENGKKAIVAALVGLAIGVAAPSLLKELGNTIGWGGVNGSAVAGALTLSEIAIRVLNFLLGTMGILALIMLVIGAIMYLTSAGDEDRIDKGKEIFKFSLLGVIIAMSSMVLVTQIAKFFQ